MSNRKICWYILCITCLVSIRCPAIYAEIKTPAKISANKSLLVIAPKEFRESLTDYVSHKQQQLSVQVMDLETILKESDGRDDPERLKRYLYIFWKEQGMGYVLLVGDADIFPVRYMVLDRITPAAFDFAFYPSDLYYADLARKDGSFDDWNAQKESFHSYYYGEVQGEKNKEGPINLDAIDYIPEIAVGRWPVSTREEVKTAATKTMVYENNILAQTESASPCIAFVNVAGWVDARAAMDTMSSYLSPDWTVEKRYFSDNNESYKTPPPTADEVVSLLNKGIGVLCHAGHGLNLLWEGSFSLENLGQLQNANNLPIVFSAACYTARFATLPPNEPYIDIGGTEHKGTDQGEVFLEPPLPPAPYQKGQFNPPGLGELLLRSGPNGAVAYIGCNTGGQPCALTLMDGFVGGLHQQRLGDCWNYAITQYYARERLAELKPTASWYPPSIFFQGMKYMLFGDPTLILPASKA